MVFFVAMKRLVTIHGRQPQMNESNELEKGLTEMKTKIFSTNYKNLSNSELRTNSKL